MSRFAPFHRVDVAYRVINGVPIEATILTPLKISKSRENSRTKPQPVLVRWHGGGFIVGHRMYEPWFAQWLLDLAIDHGAIIVTPDYRLLPESNGADILSDVAHFWRWMQRDLAKVMEGENLPRPDLSNVLCCGESSGGFISVYCALHLESMLRAAGGSTDREAAKEVHIRAVISISAPLDATAPEYKIPRPRVFMGQHPPPPRQALSKIRAYIKSIRPGSIRTGCEPTSDMWELLLCIGQQACLPRLFGLGDKEEGVPVLEELMETLERKENPMTPVWLVHGRDDTMCPSACSSGFAERLRSVQPDVPLHLSLLPGEHLFDVDTDKDVRWVQQGIMFINTHWPRSQSTQLKAPVSATSEGAMSSQRCDV